MQGIARRNPEVARYPAAHNKAVVNGRLFHRVAIGGFADRASANGLCATIKAQGGQCFVRGPVSAAPANRWAAAKPKAAPKPARPQQLASR